MVYSVVKEGDFWVFLRTSRIVLAGAIVSNLVCYLFWPQSAATNLRKNMSRTMTSFATLLELLTNTFLISEAEPRPSSKKLQAAVANHQSCFTGLKRSLSESRAEYLLENKEILQAYSDAVGCLNRLGQHLNGLRSGTRLQSDLWQAAQEGRILLRRSELDEFGVKNAPQETQASLKTSESTENLQVAALAFVELIDDMGPPLQALSVRILVNFTFQLLTPSSEFLYRILAVSGEFLFEAELPRRSIQTDLRAHGRSSARTFHI